MYPDVPPPPPSEHIKRSRDSGTGPPPPPSEHFIEPAGEGNHCTADDSVLVRHFLHFPQHLLYSTWYLVHVLCGADNTGAHQDTPSTKRPRDQPEQGIARKSPGNKDSPVAGAVFFCCILAFMQPLYCCTPYSRCVLMCAPPAHTDFD